MYLSYSQLLRPSSSLGTCGVTMKVGGLTDESIQNCWCYMKAHAHMQNFHRQVTFKFHCPWLSKFDFIVVFWIRELGNSITVMYIWALPCHLVRYICVLIIFMVTISTLLTGSEMLRNIQTEKFHRPLLRNFARVSYALESTINFRHLDQCFIPSANILSFHSNICEHLVITVWPYKFTCSAE